jgi:hypothetical protein
MTEIYVCVDDFLKAHPGVAQWRRSPNHEPEFTDAEVITIGLMQECLGVATLKEAYEIIVQNDRSAFPLACSYQRWIARLHQLEEDIGRLVQVTRRPGRHQLYLVDAKPIPMCKPIRHGRVRLLREDGAYFGKTSAGWFFGFKLHLLREHTGGISDALLTPANGDDRDPALELARSVDGGIRLGDLGYRGPQVAQWLADQSDLLLITRADVPDRRELISTVRQGIETLFSQRWRKFIDRVFSRSWRGLWNTIKLKLLHYNLRHAGLLSA